MRMELDGALNVKPLSKREEKKLNELEAVIDGHQRGFYAVGMALVGIRDEKLYRLKSETFESYANEVWGLDERSLERFMAASRVFNNLQKATHGSPNGHDEKANNCSLFAKEDLPTNERQCRPLTSLTPEEQTAIWQLTLTTAEEADVRITAALVASCVREYKGEKFRENLDKIKKDLEKKPAKEQGQNISPQMDTSYRLMLSTIEAEMHANWRKTSKEKVQVLLENLLAAVNEL